jgi:hypothetical protein
MYVCACMRARGSRAAVVQPLGAVGSIFTLFLYSSKFELFLHVCVRSYAVYGEASITVVKGPVKNGERKDSSSM